MVVAARLAGVDPDARYTGGATVTRLKAFGLDVVALGAVTADVYGPHPAAADDPGEAEIEVRAGTGCGGCSTAVDGICGWLREAG